MCVETTVPPRAKLERGEADDERMVPLAECRVALDPVAHGTGSGDEKREPKALGVS